MSAFFDLFILVVIAISVISGWRRGFVKSIMGLASSVLSYFAAIYFTPYLSSFICEHYVLGALSSEVGETLSSLLWIPSGEARSTMQLFGDMPDALSSILERFGTNTGEFTSRFMSDLPATDELVGKMSDFIVRSTAQMISSAISFAVIFITASVALTIITAVIGFVCELPVLHQLDEFFGLLFGIVSALVYAVVLSIVFVHLASALSVFDPSMFSKDMTDSTYLVKFFSGFRLEMLTELLSYKG